MTVLMCAYCGSDAGDDPYAFTESYPFCSESCYEQMALQLAEDDE